MTKAPVDPLISFAPLRQGIRISSLDKRPHMIDLLKGRFKLDEYETVIHPFLTLQEFRAGDFKIENGSFSGKSRWSMFEFPGHIYGMKADFSVTFDLARVCWLNWTPSEDKAYWSETSQLAAWLVEITTIMPPYHYDWGGIITGPNEREDALGVFVGFKESFNKCAK